MKSQPCLTVPPSPTIPTTGTAARIYSPQGALAKRTTTNGESHTFYYHLDNRDPVKGQLTDPQTPNAYSYCLGNPLKYVDPDGRDPIFCDEKEDMSPVIHGSYVPQFIEARDPDKMMNEEGLILR